MRILMISARREPFEIGARLLAALAFPATSEESERRKAVLAWCTSFIASCIKLEPGRAKQLQQAFPNYVRMTDKEIRQALRKTQKRLNNRTLAGKMARGYIREFVEQRPAPLPASMARLSQNELSKFILKEAHQSDPHNVERRIWGLSKPVIHLAAAWDHFAQTQPGDTPHPYPMDDLDAHLEVARYGKLAEPVVLNDKRFGVSDETLLRVRIQ
ncbi:MAG: hypothetical protein ABI422_00970 [Sphingomicrobium sp.]